MRRYEESELATVTARDSWIAEFARMIKDKIHFQVDFSNFRPMIERFKWNHLEIAWYWNLNLKVKLSINGKVSEGPKEVSARFLLFYCHQTSPMDRDVDLFCSYAFSQVLCIITMPVFKKNIYFVAFSYSYFSVPTILLSTLLVLWKYSF